MAEIREVHQQRYTSNIDRVKLDDGRILDIPQAVQAIKDGTLSGCTYADTGVGKYSLRSLRDGDTDNNLQNLPRF